MHILDDLAADLKAVKPLRTPMQRFLLWGVPAVVALFLIMGSIQPFRQSLFGSFLLSNTNFSVEIISGYIASFLAIILSFTLAVPGAKEEKALKIYYLFFLVVFTGIFLFSFITPSLETTMAGKREGCFFETLIYGLAISFMLFFQHRRSYFSNKLEPSIYIGIGASLLPAVTMQIACMYSPHHAISHHYAPILAVTVATVVLGKFFLKKF